MHLAVDPENSTKCNGIFKGKNMSSKYVNKTKYFRLHLTNEVSSKRPKT